MKKLVALFTVAAFIPNLSAADLCSIRFGRLISNENKSRVFAQDELIQQTLGVDQASFVFFGQRSISSELFESAIESLAQKDGLSTATIQKTHKALTGGKSRLSFRSSSEAKLVGTQSFKGRFALSKAEIEDLEKNPFLTFVPASDYLKPVSSELDLTIGDIFFPSVQNYTKFEQYLSSETLTALKRSKLSKQDEGALNSQIIDDLLQWCIKDAERSIEAKTDAPESLLGLLEWRMKSLGLYYEPTFSQKGKYLVSDYSQIGANRSNELAEAIVDAFVLRKGLRRGSGALPERGFRPQLYESPSAWTRYMKEALDGSGAKRLDQLVSELRVLDKKFNESDRKLFQDYALTRILTGTRMTDATADSIFADFKLFKKKHYSSDIPEEARVQLIPIEFIQSFTQRPKNLKKHLDDYYFRDSTLYRGVSNPRVMSEGDYLEYFKDYKGRQASELGRTVFEEREDYTKLSMLRYNADLIEGRLVHEALQHANKHASWEAPNSAKTYLVSLTDFDTVAFRFAADKGYVKTTSANQSGTSHFVMETLRPKAGSVDFGEFRKTDPNWRNHYPRQREVSIAGGVDPHSVKRIYQLMHYGPNEKIPRVGPEKHAKIIRIFERDEATPELIWILEKDSAGEWKRTRSVKF